MKALLCAICISLFVPLAAMAGTLTAIDIQGSGSDLAVTLQTEGQISPKAFVLGGEYPRLVIDVSGASESLNGGTGEGGQKILQGKGLIKQIRYAYKDPNTLRLVFDLGAEITTPALVASNSNWSFTIGEPLTSPAEKAVRTARKPVIVIDAGHGGKDPGTHGSKGTKEKDVNLLAALTLKALLDKTGRYETVMTRNTDVFIELDDRLSEARLAEADLFISLHADAGAESDLRGASVYTLASRSEGRSQKIAESQNWVMSTDLSDKSDEVSDILVDLAQRKTQSQSSEFAEVLIGKLQPVTPLLGKTHRKAGFYVLLAPDVPAVLLEMGFLSNKKDEANLTSVRHRTKMMTAVTQSIDAYFAKSGAFASN